MIKKSTVFFLVAVLFFLISNCRTGSKQPDLSVYVFEINKGWGYKIVHNNKTIIYQPFIPVVIGNVPFRSKSDARKTGEMVVDKIRRGEIPNVTREELLNSGILIP